MKKRKNRGRERGLRIAYPLLLSLLLLFSLFLFNRQQTKREGKKAEVRDRLHFLLQADMLDEAEKLLLSSPYDGDDSLEEEEFQLDLKTGKLAQAEKLWREKEAVHDKAESLAALIQAYGEGGRAEEAYRLLREGGEALKEGGGWEAAVQACFEKPRQYPVDEEFISGWYGNLAIFKGEDGYFLRDGRGGRKGQASYDTLEARQDGFLAEKKGQYLLLDQQGGIKEWLEGRPAGGEERGGDREAEEAGFQQQEKGGKYGITYLGQPILGAEYERLTPLSRQGECYGFKEGQWYRIAFPALSHGF